MNALDPIIIAGFKRFSAMMATMTREQPLVKREYVGNTANDIALDDAITSPLVKYIV